jgi:hypothetical protein
MTMVKLQMYLTGVRTAGVLTLMVLAHGCAMTQRDLSDAAPLGRTDASGAQHIERVEWHRDVDDQGHIPEDGDDQFTVLNSATVTDEALQILTGVGFQPGRDAERQLVSIPFADIVEIKLITHPLSVVNIVVPLNAGTWGSRVLLTTKDGVHELFSVAKGGERSPEVLSPTRGVFLRSSDGSKTLRGLWWPDRSKTKALAALLERKVAAFQER